MTLIDKTRHFVAETIGSNFHQRRLRRLKKTKLAQLLADRDTLLMRAQALEQPKALVKELLDAHATTADESLFADFMKSVALFVATQAHDGVAPRAQSVDLEFLAEGHPYALAVKPRSNWGSASQVGRMMEAFRAAPLEDRPADVTFLVGCLQGEGSTQLAPGCERRCGSDFWHFISADEYFHDHLVDLLEVDAGKHAKQYVRTYKAALKALAKEFEQEFCDAEGRVRWRALAGYRPSETDAADGAGEAPALEAASS